jgi:CxxC motif-containing protein
VSSATSTTRTLTCILCPNGCELEVTLSGGGITGITGNLCPKGKGYAEQEILHPMRNIASSVLVTGGELPLVSVRLTAPVPKERIFDVMAEIKKQRLVAPVHRGQVVIGNVLGLGSDVIATKSVDVA